jgi:hypothetical protein
MDFSHLLSVSITRRSSLKIIEIHEDSAKQGSGRIQETTIVTCVNAANKFDNQVELTK